MVWPLGTIWAPMIDLPYSREQKHVSISDTPILLIAINSIRNMGCQKQKLSEWAEIKIL